MRVSLFLSLTLDGIPDDSSFSFGPGLTWRLTFKNTEKVKSCFLAKRKHHSVSKHFIMIDTIYAFTHNTRALYVHLGYLVAVLHKIDTKHSLEWHGNNKILGFMENFSHDSKSNFVFIYTGKDWSWETNSIEYRTNNREVSSLSVLSWLL